MKKSQIRLILYSEEYSEEYREELRSILLDFSKELYGEPREDVDRFVKSHWAIYLCIDNISGSVIGFSSYSIYDYFGMRDKTLCNDYLYIKSEYRNSKVIQLFTLQSTKICLENDLPLETPCATDGSFRLAHNLKGKKIYETYIYEKECVESVHNRLSKIIKIKD